VLRRISQTQYRQISTCLTETKLLKERVEMVAIHDVLLKAVGVGVEPISTTAKRCGLLYLFQLYVIFQGEYDWAASRLIYVADCFALKINLGK
jgi:hypothetical protein